MKGFRIARCASGMTGGGGVDSWNCGSRVVRGSGMTGGGATERSQNEEIRGEIGIRPDFVPDEVAPRAGLRKNAFFGMMRPREIGRLRYSNNNNQIDGQVWLTVSLDDLA